MNVDELFQHAMATLPEAAGDLMRNGRDPTEFVFASFDGASELGMALIASDIATELGVEALQARSEVERMILAANHRGEELVVSLMVSKDVLTRILAVSNIDAPTRVAVGFWLDRPVVGGQYRVVAIAGEQVRAAAVDSASEAEETPVSSSMLN